MAEDVMAASDTAVETELDALLGELDAPEAEDKEGAEGSDGAGVPEEHSELANFNAPPNLDGEGEQGDGEQKAEGQETKEEKVGEVKSAVADEKKGPIPYPRFQEVIAEKNALKAQLEALKTQQEKSTSAQDVKPETKADQSQELTPAALEYLRTNSPALYEQYQLRQMKASLIQEIRQEQEKAQIEAARNQAMQTRLNHYVGRIQSEFPELADMNSEAFKQTKEAMADVLKEYDIVKEDIAATHMALALVKARQVAKSAKEAARKEVMAELSAKLKAKRGQALAGQSRSPVGDQGASRSNRPDEWGGPPAFEQTK